MSFSERYGYRPTPDPDAELIREGAPESVRVGFLEIFEQPLGPGALRDVVCQTLRRRPDQSNWSPYPNVWDEVQELVYEAPWWRFYDIVEATLEKIDHYVRGDYVNRLNKLFAEEGLAWHIVDGKLVLRTGDVSDAVVAHALDGLQRAGRTTAASELRKALAALSQRPQPDTRDAVRFAAGALEALARDVTGDRGATLGEILKRSGAALLAPPLPQAFGQIWGYASDTARHVDEHKAPTLQEAILVVGLIAAAVGYVAPRR